jgi:hypothetical protein
MSVISSGFSGEAQTLPIIDISAPSLTIPQIETESGQPALTEVSLSEYSPANILAASGVGGFNVAEPLYTELPVQPQAVGASGSGNGGNGGGRSWIVIIGLGMIALGVLIWRKKIGKVVGRLV